MLDKNGNVVTSHSMNQVPFILASERYKDVELKSDGALSNIAPTVLKLLEIEAPKDMESSLFKLNNIFKKINKKNSSNGHFFETNKLQRKNHRYFLWLLLHILIKK